MGDAAHAIVPFFGQGMNAGFEDCRVFGEMIPDADSNCDWADLFTRFSRERKPHADAIATMALENFVEMRDKVGDPNFLLKKNVEQRLSDEFPDLYRSRYRLVSFTNTPYNTALEIGKVQEEILSELCFGATKAEEIDIKKAYDLISDKLSLAMSQAVEYS